MTFGAASTFQRPIRVLIIDDSVTIRRLLRLVLSADPAIKVVGDAENPLEARELIKQTDPDVLTLDVEMPKMDGLEFLKRLMRLRPMPVVMISTLTHKGSEAAVTALALGAVDVFGKPYGPDVSEWQSIIPLVKTAARAQVGRTICKGNDPAPVGHGTWSGKIIAIGASTGGVDALEKVLRRFPADCPPTLIVQHMPELFLESLATRLNMKYAPVIQLARHGVALTQGTVLIAPGGENHLQVGAAALQTELVEGAKVSGHRPSVDVLFRSLVPRGKAVVAALLTGMGRDGAEGLGALRATGATTFAQDEASCVVYGMPRAAVEADAAEHILSLQKIGDALLAEAARPMVPRASLRA
jgi:two-component system chemotaxis response regulator CheB